MVGRTPYQWQVEHDPAAEVLILKLTLEIYLKADYWWLSFCTEVYKRNPFRDT